VKEFLIGIPLNCRLLSPAGYTGKDCFRTKSLETRTPGGKGVSNMTVQHAFVVIRLFQAMIVDSSGALRPHIGFDCWRMSTIILHLKTNIY
jgi:hypothetical protein